MIAYVLGLAGLLASLSTAPGVDEKDFEKDRRAIQRLMESSRWQAARDALLALVEEHGEAPYALRHRTELMTDLRRAFFWSTHEEPEVEDLITGKLVSWRRDSGRVELHYGRENSGDFEQSLDRKLAIHPLTFEGTFSVEIELANYDGAKVPIVVIGYDTEEPVTVVFGYKKSGRGITIRWMPARIFVGGEKNALAEADSSLKRDEPAKLRVTVKSGSITAYGNGRKLVSAKRKAGLYGQIALRDVFSSASLERVRIKGDTQPSWFQNLIDEAMQDDWKRFDEEMNWSEHVPAWLASATEPEADATEFLLSYPGQGRQELNALFEEVIDQAEQGQFTEARNLLGEKREFDVPPPFRSFTLALVAQLESDEAATIEHLDRVLESEPDHLPSHFLRALALCREGRYEAAISDLEELREERADEPEVVHYLGRCYLFAGRPQQARRVVDEALAKGMDPDALLAVDRVLTKAERGPDWKKVHEYRSKHYHVSSDIEPGICNEAARHLESSLNRFNRDLRRLPREDRRYRVFLFSGEPGYQSYLGDIIGSRPENTAGVYTSQLKQLLIWNLPDREDMFRTIRHEGFHQYFDRLVDHAPRWLDEGLAEYYENARLENGQWRQDHAHPDHLRVVQSKRLKDLQAFVHGDPGAFYRTQNAYAHAWLLVHYLLHSDAENKRRFDRMIDVLVEGGRKEAALEAAFGGLDWPQLAAELGAHARSF